MAERPKRTRRPPARHVQDSLDYKIKNPVGKVPSSSFYVGYVEDGESIEAIMKKFEHLEQYKHQLQEKKEQDNTNQGKGKEEVDEDEESTMLSTQDLEKVFVMTSGFSVMEAMTPDDEYFHDYYYDSDDSEDEDDFFGDGKRRKKSKSKRPRKRAAPRPKRPQVPIVEVASNVIGYSQRRIRIIDPHKPIYTRIPSAPIPRSWTKVIQPFSTSRSVEASKYLEVDDMFTVDLEKEAGTNFDCILMNPPWNTSKDFDLSRLNMSKTSKVVERGFIFCWVEKELIHDLCLTMEAWGFVYVENMIWVKQNVNNKFTTQPYQYFSKTKTSLLIFRKPGRIDIRHQRSEDVVFGFVTHARDPEEEDKPEFIYQAIETLLPSAVASAKEGNFKLLELWGSKDHQRTGWITISQRKSSPSS